MDRMQAIAGCWRFQSRHPSSPLPGSFVVRFDTVPRARPAWAAPFRVITELNLDLDPKLTRWFTPAYWTLAQRPGRVIASWEEEFGVELRLTLDKDTLSGTAYYTNDVGTTRRTFVQAVRLTCPVSSSVIAIRGRVVDFTPTPKPMVGASVMLSSLPADFVTNEDGNFELQVPRPDHYEIVIVIRSIRHQTVRRRIPITPFDSLQNVGDINIW